MNRRRITNLLVMALIAVGCHAQAIKESVPVAQLMLATGNFIGLKNDNVDMTGKIVTASAAFFIILILLVMYYYSCKRQRQLEELMLIQRMRIQQIKNHVSPKFLFNMLNSKGEIDESDKENIQQLSNILRAGLDVISQETVLLKDELQLVDSYVDGCRPEMNEDFSYEISIKGNIDNMRIPSLFLLTLIENAVVHALIPLHSKQRLFVEVEVPQDAPTYTIKIYDNGAGFNPSNFGLVVVQDGVKLLRKYIAVANQRLPKNGHMSLQLHNHKSTDGVINGCEAILTLPQENKA